MVWSVVGLFLTFVLQDFASTFLPLETKSEKSASTVEKNGQKLGLVLGVEKHIFFALYNLLHMQEI